jgi:hypothetical protein
LAYIARAGRTTFGFVAPPHEAQQAEITITDTHVLRFMGRIEADTTPQDGTSLSSCRAAASHSPDDILGSTMTLPTRLHAPLVCWVTALALTGCGCSHVVIARPAHPIYAPVICVSKTSRELPKRYKRVPCRNRFDLRHLLGVKVSVAEERAAQHGLQVRVTKRDGHGLAEDSMYLSNRVDVAVRDGLVTRVVDFG